MSGMTWGSSRADGIVRMGEDENVCRMLCKFLACMLWLCPFLYENLLLLYIIVMWTDAPILFSGYAVFSFFFLHSPMLLFSPPMTRFLLSSID